MNWDSLDSIDWDGVDTTEGWIKLLNDLRTLIDTADEKEKRSRLAEKLDEFADKSTSEDLMTITKLDASARKSARALRMTNITLRTQELAAASAEYKDAVKEFTAAATALKKEASLLRAEKFAAAVNALTETISSLNNLSNLVNSQDEAQLVEAINTAVKSAQKLRGILEAPA